MLAAHALSVRRGRRQVLNGVSLRASAGEFIAVIGANGAGKSTLLSVLAGLRAPDSGHVSLDGVMLGAMRPRELARHRSYLPQNPRCEWPISVERLVALGLIPRLPLFGGLPAACTAQITRVLEACDLLAQRMQPVTTLSGGELTRAMLARALVSAPSVVLVDEPISGLDPKHALDTARRLRALADEGTTVIAALHDLTLAARYANRVIALRHGSIVGDGPTRDALNPALIRMAFEVDAQVSGAPGAEWVNYLPSDG